MTQKVRHTMWRKWELYEAMKKEGWQPGTVDGLFVHKKSNNSIDMMAADDNGRTRWITYALLRITPPPF